MGIYVIIILTCIFVIFAQMYVYGLDVKQAYEDGFKKGLYMNVVRVSEGNDMEVVSKNGEHYK